MQVSCVVSALPKPTTYGTVPATYKHENSSAQSRTCSGRLRERERERERESERASEREREKPARKGCAKP